MGWVEERGLTREAAAAVVFMLSGIRVTVHLFLLFSLYFLPFLTPYTDSYPFSPFIYPSERTANRLLYASHL